MSNFEDFKERHWYHRGKWYDGKEFSVKSYLVTDDDHIHKKMRYYPVTQGSMEDFENELKKWEYQLVNDTTSRDGIVMYIQYDKSEPWHKISLDSWDIVVGKSFNNIRFFVNNTMTYVRTKNPLPKDENSITHLIHYWGDPLNH